MEVGEALSAYIREHMDNHVKKYFDTALNADVHFSKHNNHFSVSLVINEGVKKGIVIKSDGSAVDAYGAFNEAMHKAANQLRRYKNKIKNYRRQRGGAQEVDGSFENFEALKYVLSPVPNPALEEMEAEEMAEIKQEERLPIVAEKTTKIEELSVEEAIMKMDLADLPALVFINSANKKINVVYHRKDGDISWINPNL